MKCQKCGHEFEGKFCPECGTPVAAPAAEPAAPASAPVETKKAKKKNHGCLIAIVVFVIIGIIGAGMSSDDSSASTAATGETATATAEPTAAPTTEPTPEPTPVTYEATTESLTALFDSVYENEYQDFAILVDAEEGGSGLCMISYKATGSYWDENALVTECVNTYIDFCRTAYTIDGITTVDMTVSVPMVDDRGNENTETGVEISMAKDVFALYNWDNVTGSVMDQMERDCSIFYIHPGILKNVDDDDIIYY